jgi:hypothetical protein
VGCLGAASTALVEMRAERRSDMLRWKRRGV